MCAKRGDGSQVPDLLMKGDMAGARSRHARGSQETPVPVDPDVLERVLRSLEEESRLDADIARAEMRLRLDGVSLRLR